MGKGFNEVESRQSCFAVLLLCSAVGLFLAQILDENYKLGSSLTALLSLGFTAAIIFLLITGGFLFLRIASWWESKMKDHEEHLSS